MNRRLIYSIIAAAVVIAGAALLLKTGTSPSLVSSQGTRIQTPATPAKTPELYFNLLPSKQFFSLGEPVDVGLELYSRSEKPILVGSFQGDDFVTFKVLGPDGKELPWHGNPRSETTGYLPSDFTVLDQYKGVSATRIISLKNGEGFAFERPGQYSLTAQYSMGRREKFAPYASQAEPVMGTFQSSLAFCIEACILEPLPVRSDVPRSALDRVRQFYSYIAKFRPLGLPSGRAKKALWPLLSQRLAQRLDSFEACDEDYFRRYGEMLRANQFKPTIPWLEEGLFTGPNDASTSSTFRILSSRSVGENRVDVLIAFKEDWGEAEGVVTAILENNRWLIDEYVAMYGNDELHRVSAGYPDCKDGQWVGDNPY